jgi:hypothetical protein
VVAAKRAYLIEPERSVCLLSGNQLLEDADFTHQYDNNGNMIQKTAKQVAPSPAMSTMQETNWCV